MADKKFGRKRVCPHCEKKFYDLNKKSPLTCPCGEKEIAFEEDFVYAQLAQVAQAQKPEVKDEFADIENADNASEDEDEEVISLDDASIEEEEAKN